MNFDWKSSPVTLAMVVVSIAVFGLMTLWSQETTMRALMISQYIRPTLPEIKGGELWRLLTPALLHFSIFHIAFNMLWTWQLGQVIESRQGSWIMLGLFVITGVLSNLAQYWIDGPVFGGMSGVVYGLFGYVWIQGMTNPRFGVRLNPGIVKLMLGWFVICWSGLLEKFFGLAVANTAHTAGLAGGVVLALLVTLVARKSSRS